MEELKRMNIRVSKKVKEYFEQRSKDTGAPQSALMILALEEYIDQKTMIETSTAITKLEEVQRELRKL